MHPRCSPTLPAASQPFRVPYLHVGRQTLRQPPCGVSAFSHTRRALASLCSERSFAHNALSFVGCGFDCFPCAFPGKADNCAGEVKRGGPRSAPRRAKGGCLCALVMGTGSGWGTSPLRWLPVGLGGEMSFLHISCAAAAAAGRGERRGLGAAVRWGSLAGCAGAGWGCPAPRHTSVPRPIPPN